VFARLPWSNPTFVAADVYASRPTSAGGGWTWDTARRGGCIGPGFRIDPPASAVHPPRRTLVARADPCTSRAAGRASPRSRFVLLRWPNTICSQRTPGGPVAASPRWSGRVAPARRSGSASLWPPTAKPIGSRVVLGDVSPTWRPDIASRIEGARLRWHPGPGSRRRRHRLCFRW